MSFSNLGLEAAYLRAIAARGYSNPTPIQAQAIPVVLAGRDVLAGAQTGTGKTAAFAIPVMQRLGKASGKDKRRAPRALVLAPTRELAAQVGDSFDAYGTGSGMRSTVVFGGVGIEPQKRALARGIDVLVATPGRLLDLHQQQSLDLSAVEILVLDEADRMLDMGFIHDIRKIIALLPRTRQNLLFSATYSDDIRALADRLLHDPAEIEVARRSSAAANVTHYAYRVDKGRKRHLLAHLITEHNWYQALVFTRTKHGANRLATQLARQGIEAAAIHGNKSQSARTRALAGFKSGQIRVLVATDIAARGLDIEGLPYVVNFELPNVPEDYVHRIGRTGRAAATGEAISLVSGEENGLLKSIQKLLGGRIETRDTPRFEPVAETPAEATAGAERQGARTSRGAAPDKATAAKRDGPARRRRPRRRRRSRAEQR